MVEQTTDTQHAQILERLKRLEETIQQLQQRLEQKETQQQQAEKREERLSPSSQTILEIDLMNLPDSLRKTMLAMAGLKEVTAEEVAKETNRTRGLENIYLNQLERLGHVEKVRRGKRVYFRSLRVI